MVCEDNTVSSVVVRGVYPDLAGVGSVSWWWPPRHASPCSLLPHHNTMTIVSSYSSDVVPVVVGERGVVGGCLLTAMSGVDAPPVVPPSPPPSPPHTALPPTDNHHHDSSIGSEGVPGVVGRGRRKLENEDSSYDSDFEPCERPDDDEHEDVCRTVSDTLCAEYADYVTQHSPPTTATSTTTATTNTTTIVPTTLTLATNLTAASSTTASVITVTSTTAAVTTTAVTTPSATTAPVTTATTVSVTTTTAVTTSKSTSSTGCEGKTVQEAARSASPAVRVSSAPSVSVTPPALPTTPTTTIMTIAQPLPSPNTAAKGGTVTTVTSSVQESLTPACSPSEEQTTTTGGVPWVVLRPSYASQVEFGVKLGYSEALVQMALVKLGGTPDKDELLAELIRLVSSVPRADGEGDSADDVTDAKEDVEHYHHHHHLQQHQQPPLKPIIIDGSNVAMSHGNKTTFSCSGLRVCVDWFRARGHTEITVFVPAWRKEAPRWDTPIVDQDVLLELERERILVFTPSRVCGGKRIVSYDDRYILKEAVTSGGVVVSNDNYRDLAAESQAFRRVIEESLLMYSWVNGRFVPPDDPLGRSGPTLDVFLRRSTRDKQALCPYGRKCTYGNKCKYMHPERGTAPLKSVTERLQEQVQKHYQNKAKSRDSSPGEGLRLKSLSLPVGIAESDVAKKPLARTQSIVPSVSLTLPSALTQETPTHDRGPGTSSTSSHSHNHLMPPHMDTRPLDPLRSSTMFKSDSSLYHIYPSQSSQTNYGAATWWKGQGNELPMRTMASQQGAPPQSPSQMYGSHLSLTKQMSDPDPAASDNPHRKLQRQLTLNPAYDSRLYKIVGFREPAPEHFSLAGSGQQQQQTTGQGSPSRTMNRDNEALAFSQVASGMTGRVSPGYSSPYGSREQLPAGMHSPLARHSSQESAKHMVSLPPHLYPTYSHPHVTRFASAPDPIWGGHQQQASPGPPQITRLNSTSDTRLNVYSSSDSHFFSDVFEEHLGRLSQFQTVGPQHNVSPGPGAPSPGPIGSRPMSPQQGPVLHHSPSVSPRQHTPPQQQPVGLSSNFSNPTSHEDARLHVFYHLSNLFPEAQVRAVLAMYLEETDPQKICSYILSHNPGPVGSRPMSPQQLSQSGVGHQSQGVPVCGSSPLKAGFSSSLPTAASSHEDARLRIFYHLSQLFPVAQVRAVLARYPEETDAKQLCATLLSHLSGNQS